MTGVRLLSVAATILIGLLLVYTASHYGQPLYAVRWAGLVMALAGAFAILRGSAEGERSRAAFGMGAGLSLLVAAASGLHALWLVAVALWRYAHPYPHQSLPTTLNNLNAVIAWAWHVIPGSLVLWGLVAVLPLFAGILCTRLAISALLLPSRDVAGGPWGASWMTPGQARYLAQQQAGLPLGRLKGRLLRFAASAKRGWRGGHHMLIAGTRAGKGVSSVIPAIIDHDGPVVALDIKGELFAVTRRWRRSLGRKVVVLNPFDVIEANSGHFNVLDYVRPEPAHIARDAATLADGLVKPEAGSAAHFSEMARQLIAAAIEVVATVAEPEARNLNTVADILLGPDVRTTLEAWRDSPDAVGRSAARTAAAVLAAGDREYGGIFTTIAKSFAWASSEPMQRLLAKTDFRLDELLAGGVDLFIVVPLDMVDDQSVFLRLLINMVTGAVVRESGRRNLPKPLLLVLDEFVRLGRMGSLVNIATVGAGAGIEAMFVTQDLGQVEQVYGKGDANTLLGACATTRVFGLGRTETATAERLVSAFGDKTVQTQSSPLQDAKKASRSEQRSKLFTVAELLEMPSTDMVAMFSGKPPLRLKLIVSHTDPAYRGKLDTNPTLRR